MVLYCSKASHRYWKGLTLFRGGKLSNEIKEPTPIFFCLFKKQKQQLTEEFDLFRQTSTRLYYLDAALSADSLLAHYQTRDDVLILRGTVFINSYNSTHTANLISNDQQQMQLSKPLTDKLVQILGSDDIISSHSQLPRYQIKLAEGGNYNPWISDVMPLE